MYRDITQCSPLKINGRFWGADLLATCFHVCFLFGLFFEPEYGSDMFFRNVSWISTNYPRRQNLHNHCCENLIFYKLYRVSREEISIFWEVITLVILSKKLYMYMCPILNGFRDRAISLYSSFDLTPNIVLPSRMRIVWKCQLAVVTVDSDNVRMLWEMPLIFRNAEYSDKLICYSHTSCKVQWCWPWNFRKYITLGILYQLSHLNNKCRY
jgi:hypothetical protein